MIVSGGDVAQGVTVSIYTDSTCSADNKVKSGSSGGSTARITLDTLTPNVAYTFYTTIENINVGNKSNCSSANVRYTYLGNPGTPGTPTKGGPNRLTFVGTSQNIQTKLSLQDSPSIRAHNITGGQTISVYNSNNCSGSSVASVKVPNYITSSYIVTLRPLIESGTYTFSVGSSTGTGPVQCSQETLTYIFYKPLAVGKKHTCYLFTDGKVGCWGSNVSGQLGQNDTTDISQPGIASNALSVPIVLGTYTENNTDVNYTAKFIATGDTHSCAILNTDDVKCWGLNDSGQLGQNNTREHGSADDTPSNGTCTGSDTTTGFAANDSTKACSVARMDPIVFKNSNYQAKSIATGGKHTCMIIKHENSSGTPQEDDGKLLCWGDNQYGQLGQDNTDNHGSGATGSDDVDDIDPIKLGASTAPKVKAVAAGGGHTCAILASNNQVMCWGLNDSGQLGLGTTENKGDQSNEMESLSRISLGSGRTAKAITAGASHTCVLLDNNQVKCWGLNTSGQLGQNDTNNYGGRSGDTVATLSTINLGSSYTAKAVSAGGKHTCVTLNNDQVKCFGENESGQLGQNDVLDHGSGRLQADDVDELSPIALGCGNATGASGASSLNSDDTCATGYQSFSSKILVAGGSHTCSVLVTSYTNTLDHNSLKCWGLNDSGQLGYGDSTTETEDKNHGSGATGTTDVNALHTIFHQP